MDEVTNRHPRARMYVMYSQSRRYNIGAVRRDGEVGIGEGTRAIPAVGQEMVRPHFQEFLR